MHFFKALFHKPIEVTRLTLLLAGGLILTVSVLGILSLRQYHQLQQYKNLSHRENQDQARTTGQLVDQLVNLAGRFDQKIEQEITRQWKNNPDLNSDENQQKLVEVQSALQNLSSKVQQLNLQVLRESQGQISVELLPRLTQLGDRLEQAQHQIAELVRRYRWAENIVADLSAGVCLIQGEYIFIDPASDLPLRFKNNTPVPGVSANHDTPPQDDQFQPVSVTGAGATLKVPFTATGFLVDKRGYVLSNKHVLTPWEVTRDYQHVLQAGYEGRLSIFRAFFAGRSEPFDLELIAQSGTEDVALLFSHIESQDIPALPCQENPDRLKAGQNVLILGYPTGFAALLARLGHDELDEITGPDVPIEQIANTLARRGLIQPIGTSGMCGRISPDKIIYDAQTAVGGSGAPVLGYDGKVVAINTALLRGFTGTNFGIPIRAGLDLMNQFTQDVRGNTPSVKKNHPQ